MANIQRPHVQGPVACKVLYRQGFGGLRHKVRFSLLALKLRPWCGHQVMYRQGSWVFFRSEIFRPFRNVMSFLEYDFRVPAGTRGLYSRARAKSGPGPIQKLRARVPENP